MIKIDKEGKRLCDIQAELFEKSIISLDMSSQVFVRRFMNSKVATELDSRAFLDANKTIDDIFRNLDDEYGESSYGSIKYNKDIMYWVGYLYRYFSYTYEVSSKQAYKLLPFKYIAGTFIPYHSLDVSQAIERLLEAKNISFKEEDMLKRGVDILRVIRNNKNPYIDYPVFGNERFYIRQIEDEDSNDLLRVYSDKESLKYFNSDNCNGDDFHYSTIKQMKNTIDFWEYAYQNKSFVRWAIYDKKTKTVIGTIEQFHRNSNDYFNDCSMLRLDLRSDYEKEDVIIDILRLITPSSFNLFECEKIITKSFVGNIERENALNEVGFKESKEALIGHNNEKYYGYYELERINK